MLNLREAIKRLTKEQKALLDYAFENQESEYVVVDNYFIGVNVNNPRLTITESIGLWSIGRI